MEKFEQVQQMASRLSDACKNSFSHNAEFRERASEARLLKENTEHSISCLQRCKQDLMDTIELFAQLNELNEQVGALLTHIDQLRAEFGWTARPTEEEEDSYS